MKIIKIETRTRKKDKIENDIFSEDYSLYNNSYAIVSDGITRNKYYKKGYSVAYTAAKKATEALSFALDKGIDMKEGFKMANNAVKELNQKEKLFKDSLAGTCLVSVLRKGDNFTYGQIGDSRAFRISSKGDLFLTRDMVKECKEDFLKEGGGDINKLRNNPNEKRKTFGALTGEEAALEYFIYGNLPFHKGDVVGVFSDGVSPFFESDKNFLKVILRGDKEEIEEYLEKAPFQNDDEKTLIFFYDKENI